ncbi:glycoside hydrolase family 18 [Paenibacillus hemerocallicola]|uniref:Glycoside hydrolase family 18 n=1 Tax=Paenibacillus hemerocallicola TaxID=1172614 RepID=A0A5C4T2Y9_9BACL|nr:glycosyl hydrolase family 18 protein [Paenibacillus hemerocallicola]TNJ63100.1 glycoside hydrolase family 18 [Paenibacillus hemerocallicola]
MRGRRWIAALLVSVTVLTAPATVLAATNKTTKYRVYQNETAISEFSDLKQAITFAGWYSESYVEEISTRKWVWNNYPRYKLYQFDVSLPGWEFATLDEAKAAARYYKYTSIRDMQSTGWVWNNYPRYRLYQGNITLDEWEFTDLKEAMAAAKYYLGAHVIDLNTNKWVWDNLAQAEKQQLRQGPKIYQVKQNGTTKDEWTFAYLEDAINEAVNWSNSVVVDSTDGGKVVYANSNKYKVYQDDNLINEFASLDDAIYYAQWFLHIKIKLDGKEIWNNFPYYQVFQNNNKVAEFKTIQESLQYAEWYKYISIRSYHGSRIWSNFRKLLYWGWNGSSAAETIKKQVQTTVGLDIDSPTWFQLADASGNLKDTSNKESMVWLKSQGYQVHPLVSNQFDSALTTQFLANPTAQQTFISALVNKAADLGVEGINIDFENLSAKDRAAFTAFIQSLTTAAHNKGLIISIDLPRGSVKWNHLTAFDHEKLAGIVDYIITMTYDQHYSGSGTPGSVSGLQWSEEGVKEFLEYGIPRDKLLMGIPYYVREWKIDGTTGALVSNRAIYMKDLPALIETKKAVSVWDPQFQQYKVEYAEDGYNYVFWLEDEKTVQARIDIAKKYDLAGVAAWRLGYETTEVWNSILPKK